MRIHDGIKTGAIIGGIAATLPSSVLCWGHNSTVFILESIVRELNQRSDNQLLSGGQTEALYSGLKCNSVGILSGALVGASIASIAILAARCIKKHC